jgi:hypothetical protein
MQPSMIDVPPKLYEPLFILANKQQFPDVPILIKTKTAEVKKESESIEQGELSIPDIPVNTEVPTLHVGFAWSNDGTFLSGIMTDSVGECLETFTAGFTGFGDAKKMGFEANGAGEIVAEMKAKRNREITRDQVSKLWDCVERWIATNWSGKTRVVIGSCGSPGPHDVDDWTEALDEAFACGPNSQVCEVVIVNVSFVRNLHLLSVIDEDAARSCPCSSGKQFPLVTLDDTRLLGNPRSSLSTHLAASQFVTLDDTPCRIPTRVNHPKP